MVVDVAAIVTDRQRTEPTASRFLLLIVAGNLKGSQSIPLDASAECKPEQAGLKNGILSTLFLVLDTTTPRLHRCRRGVACVNV